MDFLLSAINNPENNTPIPAPAPITPIVANPAPIDFPIVVNVKKKNRHKDIKNLL